MKKDKIIEVFRSYLKSTKREKALLVANRNNNSHFLDDVNLVHERELTVKALADKLGIRDQL